MRAAVLSSPGSIEDNPLHIREIAKPSPLPGEVLLKVLACGVCHTDLHIAEGELPPRLPEVVPGHQIVGQVVDANGSKFSQGDRVGVSWLGGTDGSCPYCANGQENLCDRPVYTGYTRNGGFAEYTTANADFLSPLPTELAPEDAAPLLCAGIIGFRSARIADIRPGQRIGLFGFGSSAQLLLPVLLSWKCEVYVSTREARHQQLAIQMGAEWVGGAAEVPPLPLHAAITFAPIGEIVIAALRSLAKGGILAINAIHLDYIPRFDYDSLLWGERQIRSVTNMTRVDARDYLAIAAKINLRPRVDTYPLEQVNQALQSIRNSKFTNPSVILP